MSNIKQSANNNASNIVAPTRADLTRNQSGDFRCSKFVSDANPMLCQEGDYPIRKIEEFDHGEWISRGEQPVSDWLADWEDSLGSAGWVVIRKLPSAETEGLPYEEISPAYPADADLFCPRRRIFLTLLPSKIPDCIDMKNTLPWMQYGCPGSLMIIHAKSLHKLSMPVGGNGQVRGLLSPKSTALCIEAGGLVEFQGVLYETAGPPDQSGDALWTPTQDPTALEVFHEYRIHSRHYRENQAQRDELITECEDSMARQAERPTAAGNQGAL